MDSNDWSIITSQWFIDNSSTVSHRILNISVRGNISKLKLQRILHLNSNLGIPAWLQFLLLCLRSMISFSWWERLRAFWFKSLLVVQKNITYCNIVPWDNPLENGMGVWVRLHCVHRNKCQSLGYWQELGLPYWPGFYTKGRPLVKSNLICPSDKLSWQPGCPILNINIQGNFCISQGNGSSDNLPENLV